MSYGLERSAKLKFASLLPSLMLRKDKSLTEIFATALQKDISNPDSPMTKRIDVYVNKVWHNGWLPHAPKQGL